MGERRGGSGRARRGERAPKRPERRGDTAQSTLHLSDEIVKELHATARPGKAEILVKVFGEAAGAFVAGDYRTAIRLGEQAKHLALRSASAREFLGLAYYRAGKWSEAARELAAFRRISGTTEQNPVLADAYRALGKPDKALEYANEIEPRASEPPVYYEGAIVAAGALADVGRMDEAIARLEALDLRPKIVEAHHLRAWYALADLLERTGRFTQAREWFEAVDAADPEMTDAGERLERIR